MAHELARNREGRANVFSVRMTMWHQEGVVLPDAPSFEEAMAIAELDYPVEKQPTYRDDGSLAGAYVTVRTDSGQELGIVSSRYQVVQNRAAFRVLTPLVDEGIATIETGGVLRDGADAWMLLRLELDKFPKEVIKAFCGHRDKVLPYVLIANNHSGRRGILAALTAVRVVCANTLSGAEEANVSDQVKVMHTEMAEQKLVEAAHSLWGDITERYKRVAAAYEEMRSAYIIPKDFQKLVVNEVAEDPRHNPKWNPEAKMAESVVARYEAKRYCLNKLFLEGEGHTGEPTAWFAYNAAVEALDHNEELWPNRSGVYRTASLLDGTIRQKKERVFTNLVTHIRKGRN